MKIDFCPLRHIRIAEGPSNPEAITFAIVRTSGVLILGDTEFTFFVPRPAWGGKKPDSGRTYRELAAPASAGHC
jgi:hypothetical protein